jgi:hypothetical protein
MPHFLSRNHALAAPACGTRRLPAAARIGVAEPHFVLLPIRRAGEVSARVRLRIAALSPLVLTPVSVLAGIAGLLLDVFSI